MQGNNRDYVICLREEQSITDDRCQRVLKPYRTSDKYDHSKSVSNQGPLLNNLPVVNLPVVNQESVGQE